VTNNTFTSRLPQYYISKIPAVFDAFLQIRNYYKFPCEKVVKNPGYLYPYVEFRANLMRRIKNNFKVLTDAVEDPFQRTIGEY
jgi:hypothetical protein